MSVLSFINRRKERRFGRFSKVLLTATIAVAGAAVISGCGDSASEKPTNDMSTGPATVKSKGPISREAVETVVTRKLGDAESAGEPVIRQLTLTPDANGVSVSIDLNRTSSCHPGQLTGTAITMAQQVMSALFLYPDVSQIQLTLYGTTTEVADKDKPATSITVTRERASNIDWFQFTDANVEKLASSFWVDPVIYANWKQFGGEVITDDAAIAAANAAAATTTATP